MNLFQLQKNTPARITEVLSNASDDTLAKRLEDVGFVPGERLRVVAKAPLWKDPILVEIGFTRFALRKNEAARILVHPIEKEEKA